jgi:enterochelin esterase-like enzyme
VPVVAPQIFAQHLQFFIEEVVPAITREFQLSTRREDRALFGFSSGAAFTVSAVARHPSMFSHALAFSLNLPRVETAKPMAPTYYFAAGELEPYFLKTTRNAHEQVSNAGTRSTFRSYLSGHDLMLWQLALSEYLPEIFPRR